MTEMLCGIFIGLMIAYFLHDYCDDKYQTRVSKGPTTEEPKDD